MMKKKKTLNENESRTIVAVFGELVSRPYSELNTFLGSITIQEMVKLNSKLDVWYKSKVLNYKYDEDYGWYDPDTTEF